MWIAQQPCGHGSTRQWKLYTKRGTTTITDPSGGYGLTVSNRPYYGDRLLALPSSIRFRPPDPPCVQSSVAGQPVDSG